MLKNRLLYPVFQPIVNLEDASVYAHEALIRRPQSTALHSPDALLKAADLEGLGYEFENAYVVAAIHTSAQLSVHGLFFVNISASALTKLIAKKWFDEFEQ